MCEGRLILLEIQEYDNNNSINIGYEWKGMRYSVTSAWHIGQEGEDGTHSAHKH